MINIIGEMATWHISSDALLCMDIEALGKTVSGWTKVCMYSGVRIARGARRKN